MVKNFSDDTQETLEALFSTAQNSALIKLIDGLSAYVEELDRVEPRPMAGSYEALRDVVKVARPFVIHQTNDDTVDLYSDPDLDYNNWHRLTRTLWFHWADQDLDWQADAAAPRHWCTAQVYAFSEASNPVKIAEVGAGVSRLAHDVMMHRPKSVMWIGDDSLESLVLSVLLHDGNHLTLPRRTSFNRSSAGMTWFECKPSVSRTEQARVVYAQRSLPRQPQDEGYDFVVAMHCISFFPDPLAAITSMVELLRPGGRLVFTDLFSWRVETPEQRRLRGLPHVKAVLESAGCSIRAEQRGIPSVENWGFGKTCAWQSHALVAQRM